MVIRRGGRSPDRGEGSEWSEGFEHFGEELGEKARELKERAGEKFESFRETASELYEEGRKRTEEWRRDLEERVQAAPMKSLLIAAGIGLVLVLAMRSLGPRGERYR
jgi:ElaB/YqjD/DUF883 family membrane-anchored ribosome-binding protein